MKVKKIFFIVIAAIALSACGESGNAKEPEANPQEKEDVGNKENVKAVVDAVSDEDVRYKMYVGDEAEIGVVANTHLVDGKTYGFEDPYNVGISIYAHALEHDLNEEQRDAMGALVRPSDEDIKEIIEKNEDDFKDGEFPNEGVEFDYVTLSNVEAVDDKIIAYITVHWKSANGSEETEEFKTETTVDEGDTEIDEEEVEKFLSSDCIYGKDCEEKMPTYYERKNTN